MAPLSRRRGAIFFEMGAQESRRRHELQLTGCTHAPQAAFLMGDQLMEGMWRARVWLLCAMSGARS